MTALSQYSIRGTGAHAIATSVEAAVREGQLSPGAPLPTVRALAEELRLSPATVAAAYRLLAARGLVSGQGRRGTRVSQRPAVRTPTPVPIPAGLRDVASGNPDAALLPALPIRELDRRPRLYGVERVRPELLALGKRLLAADAVPVESLTVVGGALDGIERVLQAHLGPGDRIAVEDPGYSGVLDLVSAMGFVPDGVEVDNSGMKPAALAAALRRGCRAIVVTPRAQNPTGAAFDRPRARQLADVVDRHPDVLLIEDDHAGPIAGEVYLTLSRRQRRRWAVVRSVSKFLGPDLRLAFLAGDAVTLARVEGRQHVGSGWVSHVLQQLAAALLADRRVTARLAEARRLYAERREALLAALASHGIVAHGRSGLNVWVPVVEEQSVVAGLALAGWAARAGERYRLRAAPAVRVTSAALSTPDAARLATALAAILGRSTRTRSA